LEWQCTGLRPDKWILKTRVALIRGLRSSALVAHTISLTRNLPDIVKVGVSFWSGLEPVAVVKGLRAQILPPFSLFMASPTVGERLDELTMLYNNTDG